MEKTRCLGCMREKTGGAVCEHCGFDENTRNESHQLAVGTVLKEQYQIGKVLGQGGFGITYLGWDLYLDIPVAIKEYYPKGMVIRENTMTMNVDAITIMNIMTTNIITIIMLMTCLLLGVKNHQKLFLRQN